MSDITIQTANVEGYSISIAINDKSVYIVEACPIQDETKMLCGYPLKMNYYGTKKQAVRRFNDLKRQAKSHSL